MRRWLWSCLLFSFAMPALAADQCPVLRTRMDDADTAIRIAAVACDEHVNWYRPFITTDGRLASSRVMEAETSALGDGTPAWRRVATYWRDSGLLPRMAGHSGAGECSYAIGSGYPSQACRAFVVDNPWSAAFISWVLMRAGVPGFGPAASHFEYASDARRNPDGSPYLLLDVDAVAPAPGDLLCATRTRKVYGHAGLAEIVDRGSGGLPMHCDIVVAANPDGDGKAYLVGGNVQQGVTMRILNLNAAGHFWGLPRRGADDAPCTPDAPEACDFNRQDWVALLKLKAPAQLAALGPPRFAPPPPTGAGAGTTPPQGCCINCVVGSGVPRCPAPTAPGILPGAVQDPDGMQGAN